MAIMESVCGMISQMAQWIVTIVNAISMVWISTDV